MNYTKKYDTINHSVRIRRLPMSNINLPENTMILSLTNPDFKKKAVFLSNVLSYLPGYGNSTNRQHIMHYVENLQNNTQSYTDFVATITQQYTGPQLHSENSGFNPKYILTAITTADTVTKQISNENINLAYDKARTNFSRNNVVYIPIINNIIEEEKPKYLDFNKYKQQYLAIISNQITPFSITPNIIDNQNVANIIQEACKNLDNINDYQKWTSMFNLQLSNAINKYNTDNMYNPTYTRIDIPTNFFSFKTASAEAFNASLTTTPPVKQKQEDKDKVTDEQTPQEQTVPKEQEQPTPTEQKPQYDNWSPNTKDHEERIKKWMEHIGIGDKSQDMIDKYGVELAHKIVQEAMMGPASLTSATDGKYRSSKKTIEFFVDNEISEDKLATIPGVDKDFIAQSLGITKAKPEIKVTPLQAEAPKLDVNIPTIDLEGKADLDPRAIYVAKLKEQLTIKGFSQEEISQAVDEALTNTLKQSVTNDFAEGTGGQWCGTFRLELENALGIKNGTHGKYDYIYELEQQIHAQAMDGIFKTSFAINPNLANSIAQAESSIGQFEVPENLMAENTKEEPSAEPKEEATAAVTEITPEDRTDVTHTAQDQRTQSGVDTPVSVPATPGKTWEEIVASTTPKPPANFQEFKTVAIPSFTQIEGSVREPYFDCNGHPTISTGILIYERDNIKTSGTCLAGTSLADKQDEIATATNIINDKNAYYMVGDQKFPLYSCENDKTPNITNIQGTVTIYDSKGNTVELERIPNAGAKIKKVNNQKIGKLNKKESDQMFEKRLLVDYQRVCNAIPNFKDMPTNVQVAAVHMSFALPSTFSPSLKNVNDYHDRSGFTFGENRTPEELVDYMNKHYKGRQTTAGIRNGLTLANQEVQHIGEQLALQTTIDEHSNQQTMVAQNTTSKEVAASSDNSVYTLNKLNNER